ncbi:ferric-dicitrate binding protein FerR (iron transport regulator) [Flavobacterium sp. 7E]|uniref:FecR family protein n=1 Tax=Flavobacterium sp. 7E TaxID=2735898 RepID=UPI00156E3FBB|nr:FecR domain-containing protein [Flavobacterium sp. 7E]NRS87678.1 ferric-dicitrate binding protein FerR (iron transport regulator) [Flavobacterium sp. 7E]
MPEQLQQHIKLFLEGKTSLKGQELWNNWFTKPEVTAENLKMITSSDAKIKREIAAIKKTNNLFFVSRKNWAIAASFLVLMGLSSFFYFSTSLFNNREYATNKGERSKIVLSDGTQIWLNAASTLKYPAEFKGGTREVTLIGEAFFDVAKDKEHPFIIHTDKMDTKVVGTSFNVQAYPDQLKQEVSVLTGKVNVKSTVTHKNVYVTPGQKVVFKTQNNKLHAYNGVAKNTVSPWRKNILVFEDTPFPEVIATLNRNYNVVIKVENKNLNNLKISAYFKALPVDQVIDLACNIVNATYDLEKGVYTIK